MEISHRILVMSGLETQYTIGLRDRAGSKYVKWANRVIGLRLFSNIAAVSHSEPPYRPFQTI